MKKEFNLYQGSNKPLKTRLARNIGALVLGLGITIGGIKYCSSPDILEKHGCEGIVFEWSDRYDSFIPEKSLMGTASKEDMVVDDLILQYGKPLMGNYEKAQKELQENLECNLQ